MSGINTLAMGRGLFSMQRGARTTTNSATPRVIAPRVIAPRVVTRGLARAPLGAISMPSQMAELSSARRWTNQMSLRKLRANGVQIARPGHGGRQNQQIRCSNPTGTYEVDVQWNGTDVLNITTASVEWKGVKIALGSSEEGKG
eukprot:CAMPEP_0197848478 /NCGR_PEP_ID=MMETSP1438-20131217/8854_1 /TAXON_ID=1461541 /ORGANISM="Pterosperma sp., Strain CCMP1384" /LENGTH=143 /DNA_ID=CAMNT_0043460745 /DNA_START=85 /DNA_END=512 /DNA_ORIENTATION=+